MRVNPRLVFRFGLVLAVACLMHGSEGPRALSAAENPPVMELDPGGHRSTVRAILWTPDERHVVTGSEDKTIRIYSASTGEMIRTYRGFSRPGDEGKIFALALSPDGKYLAAGGWHRGGPVGDGSLSGIIRILNFSTGEPVFLLKGHTNTVPCLAFSPDGRWLASGQTGHGDVILWEVAPGGPWKQKHILTMHMDQVYSVAFSPDSTYLATASADQSIALWDTKGKLIKHVPGAHSEGVIKLVFSPDSRELLSSAGDSRLKIWQVSELAAGNRTSRVVYRPERGDMASVAWNRQGIYAGGSYSHGHSEGGRRWRSSPVFRIDPATGEVLSKFFEHTNTVHAIALSSSGLAASSGGDNDESYIWHGESGRTVHRLMGAGQSVMATGFGKDGESIFWGSEFNGLPVKRISLVSQKITDVPQDQAPIQYTMALTGVKGRRVEFDYKSRKEFRLGRHLVELPIPYDLIRCYTFTPDGKTLIVGSNFALTSIDAETGRILGTFTGHEGTVWSLCVSPDGKRLLSGSGDQTMRLWDISTRAPVAAIFVSRDNEWLIAAPDGYFMASPNANQYFGWKVVRREDQSALFYSFDQFDLVYNRPDIVLSRLFPDARVNSPGNFEKMIAERISRIKRLWQKRVSLHGFVPEELEGKIKIQAPGVRFNNRPPDYEFIPDRVYSFTAALEEPARERRLIGYRVSVNGVPVGKDIVRLDSPENRCTGKTGHSCMLTQAVDLSATDKGRNVIEVTAINDRGIESRKEAIRVMYRPGEGSSVSGTVRPKLYIASFGIDDYSGNDDFGDLRYAVKDARDMISAFRTTGGSYYTGGIREFRKFNRDVSRESIAALQEFWKDSTVDDTVVVFFAGHGMSRPIQRIVLGRQYDDYDYFYVTPDATVATLTSRAITIDHIRGILSTSMARQKILMIDTCQSFADGSAVTVIGMRSANQSAVTVVPLKNGGTMTFRGARANRGFALRRIQQSVNDFFDLSRYFPELRRGVGVIEISAALNGQAALEAITIPGSGGRMETMKNGVFTFSVIEGLDGRKAVRGKGGITAKSLRAYVLKRVEELTTDKEGVPQQSPMVSRDIAGRDFMVAE